MQNGAKSESEKMSFDTNRYWNQLNKRLRYKAKINSAYEMRHNPTTSEAYAWQIIRQFNQFGKKFLFFRQIVIGGYILDFYCPKQMLAIEIDGISHVGRERYDAQRDLNLRRGGIKTVRFTTAELYDNPDDVINRILKEMPNGWEIVNYFKISRKSSHNGVP